MPIAEGGGDQPVAAIAEEYGFTAHYFAQLVRLGGLSPDIVTAILEGRQPADLTRTRLARIKARTAGREQAASPVRVRLRALHRR